MKKINFKKPSTLPIWGVVFAVALDITVSLLEKELNNIIYFAAGIVSIALIIYGGIYAIKYYNRHYLIQIEISDNNKILLTYNHRSKINKYVEYDRHRINSQLSDKKIELYNKGELVGRMYRKATENVQDWNDLKDYLKS